MNTVKTNLLNLNTLIIQGKSLNAFEMYYDDNVVMQENNFEPVIGKEANRKRELEFMNNITEFRSAEVLQTAVNDDVSFVIWKYDFTHKQWGVRNYTQVSVQHWKDGKIIKEQFFYNN